MSLMIIPYTSEEAWLQARTQDVTSTESAALFGLSPYMTAFELWHRKKSGLVPEFEANERMRWGNHLEEAIARGIAEQQGWEIAPLKDYMRLIDLRIGSSFDFIITNHPAGPAHLEIKNVDYMAFKQGWIEYDDETFEAPPHIEMQVQHQMAVSGFACSYIGALVGGNRSVVIERQRDEPVIAAIRAKIAAFWNSIDAGQEPEPIYPGDAEAVIKSMGYSQSGKALDMTDNPEFRELCEAHKAASERAKLAEQDKKIAQAKLLTLIGDAESAYGNGFKISAKTVSETPATIITSDMIGQTYGGRSGFRRMTITSKE